MKITLAVTAKNEAKCIQANLESLQAAIQYAEEKNTVKYQLVVILNDSTDQTKERIPAGIQIIHTSGGIIEAQRAVASAQPFVIYSDADIIVDIETVHAVACAMLQNPSLQVAYPSKSPNPPNRKSVLANALHTYNALQGFETKRSHFNGKFFAIRNWKVPTLKQFQQMPAHNFYNYTAGVLADDIYLSKSILAEHGSSAIQEVPTATIHYQAPETFTGMYRYYRRMRLEITRISKLFPEMKWPAGPPRRTDWQRLKQSPWLHQFHWLVFQLAFHVCKIRYQIDRIYYSYLSKKLCPFWPTVTESKTLHTSNAGH